jgi:methylmalonyl-CoA mutase
MSRPDFSTLNLDIRSVKTSEAQPVWMSPEHIQIKSHYEAQDIKDTEHIDFVSGIAPNLRGPLCNDVCETTMDDTTICRLFYS